MIWFLLPGILFIGAVTTFEDIREGKIKNKWTIMGLAYSLGINASLILYYYILGDMNKRYIFDFTTNLTSAIILAYSLWKIGIWTAGDGKLFITMASLVPLSSYSKEYLPYFPSLMLLINTFIVGGISILAYLAVKMYMAGVYPKIKDIIGEAINPRLMLKSASIIFTVSWVVHIFLNLTGLSVSNYTGIMLMFPLIYLLEKTNVKTKGFLLIMFASLRILLDPSIYHLSTWINLGIMFFLWRVLFSFVNNLTTSLMPSFFVKTVKTSQLRVGDVMKSHNSIRDKVSSKKLIRKEVKLISESGGDKRISERPEGLSAKDLDKIKKLGIKEVSIINTMPFAPYLFLGVLSTIILNGNVLILLSFLV